MTQIASRMPGLSYRSTWMKRQDSDDTANDARRSVVDYLWFMILQAKMDIPWGPTACVQNEDDKGFLAAEDVFWKIVDEWQIELVMTTCFLTYGQESDTKLSWSRMKWKGPPETIFAAHLLAFAALAKGTWSGPWFWLQLAKH